MNINSIVGNPPYQKKIINKQLPVYNLFCDVSFKLSKIVTLIIPARFLFNAGLTPKNWNKQVLNDEHVKVVNYYLYTDDVFDNVEVKGGVTILLRNECENFGKIGLFSKNKIISNILNKVSTNNFKPFNEIVYSKTSYNLSDKLYQDFPNLKNRQTKGCEYILDVNVFEKIPEIFYDKPQSNDDIKIIGRLNGKRIYKYIKKDYVKVNSVSNLIRYKIYISSANGDGVMGESLSKIEIGKPNSGHTQTFISIGSFDTESEAINCSKYVKTKFCRLLLGTLKITQHNNSKAWGNIPLQDFTDKSDVDWNKTISEIDQQLYNKYKLNKDEINYIETIVKPME